MVVNENSVNYGCKRKQRKLWLVNEKIAQQMVNKRKNS